LFAAAEPSRVHAVSVRHASGVDEQTSVIMQFPGQINAEFTVGMMTQTDNAAYVCGEEGYIKIPIPWKPVPGKGEVILAHSIPPRQDNPSATPVIPQPTGYRIDDNRPLYAIEADTFANCVLDSADAFVSKDDTLGNMACLELIRSQIA
jgi:predicted dehydrogenase